MGRLPGKKTPNVMATNRLKRPRDPLQLAKLIGDAGQFGKTGTEEWTAFFRDPSGNLLTLGERRF